MRILHQACVTTSLDGTDLWQTERRSSDWNVGDALPGGSGSMQFDDNDPRPTGRSTSDWDVGGAPRDQVDPRQLALAPVEPGRRASGIPNPVVAGLLMHQPIADLLTSDTGSQPAPSVGTRDAGRRPLA
jgi:hypothetical protein